MTLYLTPYGRKMMRQMMRTLSDYDTTSDLVFPVDVKAEDDGYVITALIPGVTAEDLSIQMVNETITLQGEMKVEREEEDRYLQREIPSGRFTRVITLPEQVESARAEASLENGILVLRVPKAEELRPKTIKITAK
jgi:HSP20 family protein